jgi:hypothetical protein
MHACDALHLHTVGSADEARRAVEAGVDAPPHAGQQHCTSLGGRRTTRRSQAPRRRRPDRPCLGPQPLYRYDPDAALRVASGDVEALAL